MRRHLLGLMAFFLLLTFSSSLKSQTTLAAGDIAITGYNAVNPDQVMIVLLAPVTTGTEIKLTDNGWFASGSFRSNEGTITLTFTSDAPVGTEIQLEGSTVVLSNASTATATGSVALSGSGDQLLVYQGDNATPTFITALSMEGGAWQADATNSNTSALPTGLTDGVNAFALDPEVDNALYNGAVTEGTPADVLAAVYTTANWMTNNGTPFTQTPMDYLTQSAVAPLGAGDIAITGYNAVNPDQFMFVLLAPVAAGTVVKFTDNGWLASGSFRANEGTITLTFTSDAPMGTEVQVEGSMVVLSNASTATATGSVALSGSGDQLLVYTGDDSTPTFITALSMEGGAWQADATNSNTSALPTGLTDGVNAFALDPEVDNALYNQAVTDGMPADVLAAVYTTANWLTNNSTPFTQTPMEYFAAPTVIVAADTPTLGGTASIVSGANGMVNVTSGDLNDATAWVLFTGSCGGTEVDRNATGMFTVTPTETTEYFVGGESADGLAMCDSFTVAVISDTPTLGGTTGAITAGASAMINITAGDLNDTTGEWVLFTGSCGGTEVDRNTTGMFTVTPTVTTEYFVGGESTAAGLGMCTSFTVTVAAVIVAADTPTLDGTASICPGSMGMVEVASGDLNDASVWVLFTGSCGGTEVDRNATGMFTVSPTAATEYFVGGESSDGLGMCGSFTVTPEDTEPPVITVPDNVVISTFDDSSTASTGMATATDNCETEVVVTPWINEIHYDDDGLDANEGVEIIGLAGTDLTGWSIETYNDTNGAGLLDITRSLSGILADNGDGFGTLFVPLANLQNGDNDGIALIDSDGMVIQFLSYEGVVVAQAGTANGMTSTDIMVSEPGNAAEGSSLQLEGTGSSYEDFTWSTTADLPNTFGATNTGQTFNAVGGMVTINFVDVVIPGASCGNEVTIERTFTATDSAGNEASDTQTITVEDGEGPIIVFPADILISCLDVDTSPANTGGAATAVDPFVGDVPTFIPFINEINYDNDGVDVNEGIEIAAPAGTDLTDWIVAPYNGNGGTVYNSVTLTNVLPMTASGVAYLSVQFSSLQNGNPDGIALINPAGIVVEFLSYGGDFTATNGPAEGAMSTDIGVFESGSSDPEFSLQLVGTGVIAEDFAWNFNVTATPGAVNEGQVFAVGADVPVTIEDSVSDDGRVITRTFTATDVCGNTTTETQVITIGNVAPRLQCRQPTSTCNEPGLCGNDDITLLPPFVFDDCGFGDPVEITSDQPDFFPVGTTVVTWTAGNGTGTSQCESLVIISDEEAPMVECPNDGVVNISTQNPNSCTAQISLFPEISDNCGLVSITGRGNFTFVPGLYNRPVTATDAAGNSTTCDYQIYVHDTFSPVLTNCPNDLNVTSTGEFTTVFLPQPSATDNCGSVVITNDAPEGGYPIGTTTVMFMLNDNYGNWVSCSYDVIVSAPITFAGLSDVEASLEDETTTARVAWNEPAANTSCEICEETTIENYRYVGVYRGHQYFLYEGGMTTWNEAEVMAGMLDAQLVTINTESENRFLKNALNADFSSAFTGLTQTTIEEETVMNWLTAENVDFINFDTEYTPTEEASLGLLQADGTWILVDNTVESAFLIERPCINFEQISPVLTETDEETGEVISETLLTCGSDFTEGTYVVTYRATDMCGNQAEINFDVVVEMPTATTCTTGGTESSVFIENILMGEYEMATGDDAGFGDYTEEEMTLYAVIDETTEEFTPVAMNIAAGGANGTDELFYRVWLDKNHDGDFFDADEMLAETMTTTDWAFELPAFEENMDATRMRIMVSKHDYPEVCGEVAQGEAEDYTVTILQTIVRPDGDDTRDNDTNAPIFIDNGNTTIGGTFDLFPNPAKERVNLNLEGFIGQNADLTVMNQLGQVVHAQKLTDVQTSRMTLDVKAFATGIYSVSVLTEGGELQTVKLIVE